MGAPGIEPGQEPDAHERAVQAAADLIRQDGIAALTVDGASVRSAVPCTERRTRQAAAGPPGTR